MTAYFGKTVPYAIFVAIKRVNAIVVFARNTIAQPFVPSIKRKYVKDF